MFSEILYYFGDDDLEQVLKHAAAALEPDGTLLAVHWRHPVADYPRSGDDVTGCSRPSPAWPAWSGTPSLISWPRSTSAPMAAPVSVAQATGLA